jgi:endonuclease/exonuclease/phosphatase family metal-dependent hydrolase
MRRRFTLLVIYLAALGSATAGDSRPIMLDGEFTDWAGATSNYSDPSGDGTSSLIDLTNISIANSSSALYLRFDVGRETILQNSLIEPIGQDIRIYIDSDDNPATGLSFGGIGAEMVIELGNRVFTYYNSDPLLPSVPAVSAVPLGGAGFRLAPTHSADEFEISQEFGITIGGTPVTLFPGANIRVIFQENISGDRVPDSGSMFYTLSGTPPVTPPTTTGFDRADPTDIRVLSHNVLSTGPATNPDAFQRILRATEPDIICWQEVYTMSAEDTRQFVTAALPLPVGEQWYAAKVSDCVTVARWPISQAAASDGNLVCKVNLPDALTASDFVIFNAHTPCCQNNNGREAEHDRMASIWRNMLAGVGVFPIDPVRDAALFCGDFNMVGYRRQITSLRDGDIFNNGTFGADFSPGRANGSLVSVAERHMNFRLGETWRNSTGSFAPGKLDWMLVTDDIAVPMNSYVLAADELSVDQLSESGLTPSDVNAADHYPMIADFSFPPAPARTENWRKY